MKHLGIPARDLKDGDVILLAFDQTPPVFNIELGRKYVSFAAGETDHRMPLDHEIMVERFNPGPCGVCGRILAGLEDRNQEDVCAKCWADLEEVPE